ncbi:hypothetical protein ACJX0J_012972, partial [Zea mays]
ISFFLNTSVTCLLGSLLTRANLINFVGQNMNWHGGTSISNLLLKKTVSKDCFTALVLSGYQGVIYMYTIIDILTQATIFLHDWSRFSRKYGLIVDGFHQWETYGLKTCVALFLSKASDFQMKLPYLPNVILTFLYTNSNHLTN